MQRTVCELFAGVGGFRCGLNNINKNIIFSPENNEDEKWQTVWYNQWEPAEKNTQYAHDCYKYHFGTCLDKNGEDTTNINIEDVAKSNIPDFNVLVGGFPCQDYSVASSLATSKGLEGKKGILWWSIRDILEEKKPPFVLLENVDRLLKSPASQRGRDFGIMLACFRDEGYIVEWRVINAAEYGYQQRRRRTFIFAYKNNTKYANTMSANNHLDNQDTDDLLCYSIKKQIFENGFFASTFPVNVDNTSNIKNIKLPENIGDLSANFKFLFENSGVMHNGIIYTIKTIPNYNGEQITLGDIMDNDMVDENYFIPEDRLYYTNPEVKHSDESNGKLPKEVRQTWQYIKGAKKLPRKAKNGHEYIFAEGPVPMIDSYDKPARTMLTSEGAFSRTTHIVKDKLSGRIRLLTAEETERIQGFPTGHTKNCIVNGKIIEMPINKRRFMMGNALVVNLIKDMEKTLDKIFEYE
ncbi:MAG: DNA (cytosine-5-)-methyltransferase [Clostridia bacterium]|nr:DNA (cytosine-5-)-methyltransferase [Clostridia bacterium]